MANLTCVSSGGIVHYTSGAAGAGLDTASVYNSTFIERTIEGRYGFSIIDAPNATALGLQFITNNDGVVTDEVWLRR